MFNSSCEPGILQAGGFQLSKLRQQPHLINSEREEREPKCIFSTFLGDNYFGFA